MYEQILVGREPDRENGCADCRHCKGAVSWWCKNQDAIKARGTNIPGVRNCPYWEPIRKKEQLGLLDRIFGFFSYMYVD